MLFHPRAAIIDEFLDARLLSALIDHALARETHVLSARETIMPVQNRLVAFPAFVPHEVQPVSCPDGDFAASRFSINCWLHRARG